MTSTASSEQLELPPPDVLEALWAEYCATLAGVRYDDAAVRDVWSLFQAVLLASELAVARTPAGLAAAAQLPAGAPLALHAELVFTLDLRQRELAAQPACAEALVEMPLTVIPMLEYLRAVVAFAGFAADLRRVGADGRRQPRLRCVIVGGPPTPYDALGAAQLNRLIFVSGTVVRLSSPKIVCTQMTYKCASCGKLRALAVDGGVLDFPRGCEGRCRGFTYVPQPELAACEEVQVLKIQEEARMASTSQQQQPPAAGAAAGGAQYGGAFRRHSALQQPAQQQQQQGVNKMLEVELRGFLMDSVAAGELVSVCGVVGTRRGEKQFAGTHQLCVRAVSVVSSAVGSRARVPRQLDGGAAAAEAGAFFDMAQRPDFFAQLVVSLCPGIFGNEDVKAAMLLAMAGGTEKPHMRAGIHLVLLGDPGLGKSQLLRGAAAVAPRSVVVCANTSSSCGLTVTLSRDATSGETLFEAGAVVHGDGGITCIDEIDKGAGEHKALLEVMEQESVSIAKAGMVFSMPIHTSIFAAGNPVGGRFDETKPISENVNMSPALLSRFDFIFLLRDRVDGRGPPPATVIPPSLLRGGGGDQSGGGMGAAAAAAAMASGQPGGSGPGALTSHVLHMHRAPGRFQRPQSTAAGGVNGARLLPPETVGRFIQFCREVCRPALAHDACATLRDAYLERRAAFARDTRELPVTPRYLQSLIRLTEARAKLELRSEATRADAEYAVALMRACTASYHDSATQPPAGGGGGLGGDGGGGGNRARGKLDQRQQVVARLRQLAAERRSDLFLHGELVEVCDEVGCRNPNAFVNQLNEFGIILQRGERYQLKAER